MLLPYFSSPSVRARRWLGCVMFGSGTKGDSSLEIKSTERPISFLNVFLLFPFGFMQFGHAFCLIVAAFTRFPSTDVFRPGTMGKVWR